MHHAHGHPSGLGGIAPRDQAIQGTKTDSNSLISCLKLGKIFMLAPCEEADWRLRHIAPFTCILRLWKTWSVLLFGKQLTESVDSFHNKTRWHSGEWRDRPMSALGEGLMPEARMCVQW